MRQLLTGWTLGAATGVALWSGVAYATQATKASTSVEKCQKTAQTETAKYATGVQKKIGDCLEKIASVVVAGNQSSVDVSAAIKICLTKFYDLGRTDSKSLADKMAAKIHKACDPVTEADIVGTGSPDVNQPLDAATRIGAYCANFATGAGTLVQWIDCLRAAAECQARQQIAVDFPRAPEWLRLMDDKFTDSSDAKRACAQAALEAAHTAMDSNGDDVPDLTCGIKASGNAVVGDVLTGKTFSSTSGVGLTGAMPNNGAANFIPGSAAVLVPAGYYSGGQVNTDANLVSGNIKSGATIFGVSGDSNVVNTSGATATASNIVSGQTCYANGSLVTGTVPAGANVNGANGLKTFTIPDGLYAGSKTATANDTNLTASNIVNGVTILGVTGTAGVVPSQPLKTGETTSYVAGDDGAIQKGDARSFTDNGDGTITDNKTRLMWEKKVKLDGTQDGTNLHDADNYYQWAGDCSSETACNGGGKCCQTNADCTSPHTCRITDGEGTGRTIFGWLAALNTANFAGHNDWRIPNVNELQNLVNYGAVNPSVAAAFQGASCGGACTDITSAACSCTTSSYYWSSSTVTTDPYHAWYVSFDYGYVTNYYKDDYYYGVRAVRGGL